MQQNETAECFWSPGLFVAQTNYSLETFSRAEKNNWLYLFGNADNYVCQKVRVTVESVFSFLLFSLRFLGYKFGRHNSADLDQCSMGHTLQDFPESILIFPHLFWERQIMMEMFPVKKTQ